MKDTVYKNINTKTVIRTKDIGNVKFVRRFRA